MARKRGGTHGQERRLSDEGTWSAAKDTTARRSLLSRRSYLKLGVTTSTVLTTTVGTARASTVDRHGIKFRRVCDAMSDLGMDPTGGRPIDDEIAAAGDGALIQFPDGVYRFAADSPGTYLDGKTRGFEGAGDDVTLLAPEGRRGYLLDGVGLEGAYLNNVDIDQAAPNTCVGIRLRGNRVVVKDVVARGESDRHCGSTPVFSVSTARPDGTSCAENGTTPDEAGVPAGPSRRELLVESVGYTPAQSGRVRDADSSSTDTLTIEGTGVATNYEFTVDGQIEGRTSPSGDSRSGSNVEGTIESDTVSYAIDGTITDFRLTGTANVFLNDDQVDPDTLGSASPARLVFDANARTTSYAFSVGQLYPNCTEHTATEGGARISDSVSEGTMVYRFDGGVEFLSVTGTGTLSFDPGSGR